MKRNVKAAVIVAVAAMTLGTSACAAVGPLPAHEPSSSAEDPGSLDDDNGSADDGSGAETDAPDPGSAASPEAGSEAASGADTETDPDTDAAPDSPTEKRSLPPAEDHPSAQEDAPDEDGPSYRDDYREERGRSGPALETVLGHGAWHEAGTATPSNVKNAQTWTQNGPKAGSGYLFLSSPTRNITCRIATSGQADCDNYNYYSKAKSSRTQWVFSFDPEYRPVEHRAGDAYTITSKDASVKYVMKNGDTVGWGDFVCHAETSGLTCWSTKTGHGAFMKQSNDRGTW